MNPVVVFLLSGFALISSVFQSVPPAQITPSPSIEPMPVLAATDSPETVLNREVVKFNRVIDGDTIEVLLNGEPKTIRIIGINTPETVDPRTSVECFGTEASAFAKGFFQPDAELQLEIDPSQGNLDRYGRLLRYVFTDETTDYGLAAITGGYANEYTYDGAYTYQNIYKQAEQGARETKQGLWADGVCATPSPVPTKPPSPTPSPKPTPTLKPSIAPKPTVKPTVRPTIKPVPTSPAQPAVQGTTNDAGGWTCNCSKTCPNMTCDEAQYQLNTCGCGQRDGDNDGLACDTQCG